MWSASASSRLACTSPTASRKSSGPAWARSRASSAARVAKRPWTSPTAPKRSGRTGPPGPGSVMAPPVTLATSVAGEGSVRSVVIGTPVVVLGVRHRSQQGELRPPQRPRRPGPGRRPTRGGRPPRRRRRRGGPRGGPAGRGGDHGPQAAVPEPGAQGDAGRRQRAVDEDAGPGGRLADAGGGGQGPVDGRLGGRACLGPGGHAELAAFLLADQVGHMAQGRLVG